MQSLWPDAAQTPHHLPVSYVDELSIIGMETKIYNTWNMVNLKHLVLDTAFVNIPLNVMFVHCCYNSSSLCKFYNSYGTTKS